MNEIIRSKIHILDTETTGGAATDQVIELAWIECPLNVREWVQDYTNYFLVNDTEMLDFIISSKEVYTERFKPTASINPHAYRIHGIGRMALFKCRPYTEAKIPEDTKYIIGHNISFDYRMLGSPEGVLCIDTLKIVRMMRKLGMLTNDGAGADKLDNLVDYLYGDYVACLRKPYHTALDDCYKVVLLLGEILNKFPAINTWEELFELQNTGKKK